MTDLHIGDHFALSDDMHLVSVEETRALSFEEIVHKDSIKKQDGDEKKKKKKKHKRISKTPNETGLRMHSGETMQDNSATTATTTSISTGQQDEWSYSLHNDQSVDRLPDSLRAKSSSSVERFFSVGRDPLQMLPEVENKISHGDERLQRSIEQDYQEEALGSYEERGYGPDILELDEMYEDVGIEVGSLRAPTLPDSDLSIDIFEQDDQYFTNPNLKSKDNRYAGLDKPLRNVLIFGVLLLVVSIAVIIGLITVKSSHGSYGSSQGGPTVSPSFSPTYFDDEILAAAGTISGWDSLISPSSPQSKAVGWLSAVDETDHGEFGPSFEQRYALVVFYYTTGGRQWLNQGSWLNPTLHECDWGAGISCTTSTTNRRVFVGLNAAENGLSGRIPSEVFKVLPSTNHLRLSKNNLIGSLPSEIGFLSDVSELDVSSNLLTGTIPSSIGVSPYLEILKLSDNGIAGSIPTSVFALSLLKSLELNDNQITGTLSSMFANLTLLHTLDLRHNRISGTYPVEMDQMSSLDFIHLDYNRVGGTVPVGTSVTGNRLEVSFSHNLVTGSIPVLESVGRRLPTSEFMIRIELLDFSYNQMSGTIHPLLGWIPTLRHLDMSGNQFSGTFPADSGWGSLEYIGAAHNNFTGAIPIGFKQPSLTFIDFSNNSLTGGLPQELCYFTSLETLKLNDNSNLNGSIPSCIGNAVNLHHLILSNTHLKGDIPTEIGLLDVLSIFNVSENQLTSIIPSEIGRLSMLQILDLSSNELEGSIPNDMSALSQLSAFQVADNRLTGMIPESIGELSRLADLMLAGNNLDGSIPYGLCHRHTNITTTMIGCSLGCSCCIDTALCYQN